MASESFGVAGLTGNMTRDGNTDGPESELPAVARRVLYRGETFCMIAMMLPSLSLNQAALAPPPV
jgi:hypothetical protein